MKPQPETSTQEVLAGLVERVTYHNAENGFCVLRAKVRGHRDIVTMVGHAAAIAAGEWVTATGDWVNDRTHGQQFKARFLRTSPPTSADGIEKYLSSGMIRGVGPVYAKKLVRAFGEKVFDIIETTPDRLREVDGIGSMCQNARWNRIAGKPRHIEATVIEGERVAVHHAGVDVESLPDGAVSEQPEHHRRLVDGDHLGAASPDMRFDSIAVGVAV